MISPEMVALIAAWSTLDAKLLMAVLLMFFFLAFMVGYLVGRLAEWRWHKRMERGRDHCHD